MDWIGIKFNSKRNWGWRNRKLFRKCDNFQSSSKMKRFEVSNLIFSEDINGGASLDEKLSGIKGPDLLIN